MAQRDTESMADRIRNVDVRNTPLGVTAKRYREGEIPLPGVPKPKKTQNAVFTSVDGNTYAFAYKDKNGAVSQDKAKKLNLAIILALRELELGGKASTVLSAFEVYVEDLNGQVLLPLPKDLSEEEISEESVDYSLGGA